jgi:hypothetical protein
MLEVMKDAPTGPGWRAYLDQNQGQDYPLRDRFEILRHETLAKMQASELAVPFHQLLIPAAQAAKEDAEFLTQAASHLEDFPAGSPLEADLQARFRRLQTYLGQARPTNQTIMEHFSHPPEEAVRAQRAWSKVDAIAVDLNRALISHRAFLAKAGFVKENRAADPALKENSQDDFHRWVKNNQGIPAVREATLLACSSGTRDQKANRDIVERHREWVKDNPLKNNPERTGFAHGAYLYVSYASKGTTRYYRVPRDKARPGRFNLPDSASPNRMYVNIYSSPRQGINVEVPTAETELPQSIRGNPVVLASTFDNPTLAKAEQIGREVFVEAMNRANYVNERALYDKGFDIDSIPVEWVREK